MTGGYMPFMTKFVLIFLFLGFRLVGQNNDILILEYSETNPKNKRIKTDSSIIEVKFFPEFGYIGEFNELKRKNRTYYRQFDFASKKVTQQGVWEDGYCVGLWKYYSEEGVP
jgi:hypothetical protein